MKLHAQDACDDASDAIREAKRILLEHRVQQFAASDVVALAALIMQRETWRIENVGVARRD